MIVRSVDVSYQGGTMSGGAVVRASFVVSPEEARGFASAMDSSVLRGDRVAVVFGDEMEGVTGMRAVAGGSVFVRDEADQLGEIGSSAPRAIGGDR